MDGTCLTCACLHAYVCMNEVVGKDLIMMHLDKKDPVVDLCKKFVFGFSDAVVVCCCC